MVCAVSHAGGRGRAVDIKHGATVLRLFDSVNWCCQSVGWSRPWLLWAL